MALANHIGKQVTIILHESFGAQRMYDGTLVEVEPTGFWLNSVEINSVFPSSLGGKKHLSDVFMPFTAVKAIGIQE